MYVVLLGDEYNVDFLEKRDADSIPMFKDAMKLSSLEEGLHFLAKQN